MAGSQADKVDVSATLSEIPTSLIHAGLHVKPIFRPDAQQQDSRLVNDTMDYLSDSCCKERLCTGVLGTLRDVALPLSAPPAR